MREVEAGEKMEKGEDWVLQRALRKREDDGG